MPEVFIRIAEKERHCSRFTIGIGYRQTCTNWAIHLSINPSGPNQWSRWNTSLGHKDVVLTESKDCEAGRSHTPGVGKNTGVAYSRCLKWSRTLQRYAAPVIHRKRDERHHRDYLPDSVIFCVGDKQNAGSI